MLSSLSKWNSEKAGSCQAICQIVSTDFRFLFETKRCMIFFGGEGGGGGGRGGLTLRWFCSFVYQEEYPSSLPSTSSVLNYLKICFKRSLRLPLLFWSSQTQYTISISQTICIYQGKHSKHLCLKYFHDCGCWCCWLMFFKPLFGY